MSKYLMSLNFIKDQSKGGIPNIRVKRNSQTTKLKGRFNN